jgi:phosphoribosylanthranilate isomerase
VTWIKICGLTTADAVGAALDLRVDAVGFVFTESPRQLTAIEAARLAAPARGRVALIAVTRHPTQQLLDEIIATFRPDILQTDADHVEGMRLPGTLAVLPVFRAGQEALQKRPARLLFEGPKSGSGELCDWDLARQIARQSSLILAGGLHAGNVATALAAVQPFGVDVSSGVELRPGIKNPTEMARFVAAVRAVGKELV